MRTLRLVLLPIGIVVAATLDSARFDGDYGLSFSDEAVITLNDEPVEAKLKGKVDVNCLEGRVTLKDTTNRRTITISTGDAPSLISCNLL